MDVYGLAAESAQYLQDAGAKNVHLAIVLDAGLEGFVDTLQDATVVHYHNIPHFPRTPEGSLPGRVFIGMISNTRVLVYQGRTHYYQGFPMDVVTFPIRVLKLLNIPGLVLTCAAGGLDARFQATRLMLVQDHINLMGVNPLRGIYDERFGPQFPDMSQAYHLGILQALQSSASKAQVQLRRGILAAMPGPSYETASEIKMLQGFGANAVGFTGVPEVIVANQLGIKVGAVCSITNLAAGLTPERVDHAQIQKEAAKSMEDLEKLLFIAAPTVAQAAK